MLKYLAGYVRTCPKMAGVVGVTQGSTFIGMPPVGENGSLISIIRCPWGIEIIPGDLYFYYV
jgi:hypothetical protein